MHLVKVKIINYRQLQNVELDLQDSLTVLADRKSVVQGKSVDLGGRRIIKKIFFKQKTAYEIDRRDWSSDVCSSDLKDDTSTIT